MSRIWDIGSKRKANYYRLIVDENTLSSEVNSIPVSIDMSLCRFLFSSFILSKKPYTSPRSTPSQGHPRSRNTSIRQKSIWVRYNDSLQSYPLLVKGITSGILSFSADIICQTSFPEKKESSDESLLSIDTGRLIRFTGVGALLTAPTLHFWYGFLTRQFPGQSFRSVMAR